MSPSALVPLHRVVPVALGAVGAAVCVAVIHPGSSGSRHDERPTATAAPHSTPTRARGTVAPAANAWQLRLADGHATVWVDGDLRAQQSLLDASRRKGHLLLDLREQMQVQLADEDFASRPLVVEAQAGVPFNDLVDALYTSGRAGAMQSSLAFEVNVNGDDRVIPIDVPRFPVDKVPVHRQLLLMLDAAGQVARVAQRAPTSDPTPCNINLGGDTLAQWTDALCADLGDEQIVVTVSADSATGYGAVTRAMMSASGSCVRGLVIEAGVGAGDVPLAAACGADSFR